MPGQACGAQPGIRLAVPQFPACKMDLLQTASWDPACTRAAGGAPSCDQAPLPTGAARPDAGTRGSLGPATLGSAVSAGVRVINSAGAAVNSAPNECAPRAPSNRVMYVGVPTSWQG